jgi:hypothetical protein
MALLPALFPVSHKALPLLMPTVCGRASRFFDRPILHPWRAQVVEGSRDQTSSNSCSLCSRAVSTSAS